MNIFLISIKKMNPEFTIFTIEKGLIREPTKINENGTITVLYATKRLRLRPGENLSLNTKLIVELPNKIFETVLVLQRLQSNGLNLENKTYSI